MASHKLARILESTGRLSDEEIESMSEEDAWDWLRSYTSTADADDGDCLGRDGD
jgi:hypothetical protein